MKLFVAKQFSPEEFSQGAFSYGAMFIVGIFMGENLPLDIFQEEVLLKIFQRSQSTFNVVSTNYSTSYKSFNVVKIHSTS